MWRRFPVHSGKKKNRAITWKERTMGIELIAGVWVREPSRREQTPSPSLHWERKRKTRCSMQKKKLLSWSQKGTAHPQKRREGEKEREFIFVEGGFKPCRFITSWAWKVAFQLKTARFQWGFLCCLCFGCRCAASWDMPGKRGLWDEWGNGVNLNFRSFYHFFILPLPWPISSVVRCHGSLGKRGKIVSCSRFLWKSLALWRNSLQQG